LVRLRSPQDASPPLSAIIWLPVGEPPEPVRAVRRAQSRKFFKVGYAIFPAVIGGVAGFAATTLLSGTGSFPSGGWLEVFFGVGIPVGIAEIFFFRWFGGWLEKNLLYHPRRLGFLEGKLHIELESGQTIRYPLKNVIVSEKPVADTWYGVSLPAGKFVPMFYAPMDVASAIRSAKLSAT